MLGNFRRLLLLSVGFLLLFCVFFTAQSLAGNVLDNLGFGNLGFYSLAILYLVYAFASLFATPIVIKLGEPLSLTFGSLCYSTYIASFILASASIKYPEINLYNSIIEKVIYIASAINGFGAAILWVAQGRYISRIATNQNKGAYNSIFWGFYQSSQVIGMLINAIVLSNTDTFTFYCVMTSMCIFSSLFFLFLPSVIPSPDEQQEIYNFRQNMEDTCIMLVNKRMVILYMAFITTGINYAISGSIFTPMFVDSMDKVAGSDDEKASKALYAMLGLGAGEIFGAFAFGKITDQMTKHAIQVVNLLTLTLGYGLLFNYRLINDF